MSRRRRDRDSPFHRDGDEVQVSLVPALRAELIQLAAIVPSLVEAPLDPLFPPEDAPPEPADPAVARLFPQAYRDAGEAAAAREFRRLAEGELRSGKLADAALLHTTAGLERISVDSAEAWLRAMNDVRLILAQRLGVETDADSEALVAEAVNDPENDPERSALVVVFTRLGYLMELLIEALD